MSNHHSYSSLEADNMMLVVAAKQLQALLLERLVDIEVDDAGPSEACCSYSTWPDLKLDMPELACYSCTDRSLKNQRLRFFACSCQGQSWEACLGNRVGSEAILLLEWACGRWCWSAWTMDAGPRHESCVHRGDHRCELTDQLRP